MNIDKIPKYITDDLRDRGLTPEDIKHSTPEYLFGEYCNWHGLHGWGEGLITVLDELKKADE